MGARIFNSSRRDDEKRHSVRYRGIYLSKGVSYLYLEQTLYLLLQVLDESVPTSKASCEKQGYFG